MSPKWLKANESESPQSLLDDLPRPGDFRIGSRASRAAARALLKAKTSAKRKPFRVVVTVLGRPQISEGASAKPLGATCNRRLCDDGQISEFVVLCAGDDVSEDDVSEEEAERLIPRVPVDGKTYNLANFRVSEAEEPGRIPGSTVDVSNRSARLSRYGGSRPVA